jgi:hypothetical protein
MFCLPLGTMDVPANFPDHESVSAGFADAAAARQRADVLRAVGEEIAEATGGPYTERELNEARAWLPSSSTPAN